MEVVAIETAHQCVVTWTWATICLRTEDKGKRSGLCSHRTLLVLVTAAVHKGPVRPHVPVSDGGSGRTRSGMWTYWSFLLRAFTAVGVFDLSCREEVEPAGAAEENPRPVVDDTKVGRCVKTLYLAVGVDRALPSILIIIQPAADAPPLPRLTLPYKVIKSLDGEVYRNLEFDVWQDTCKGNVLRPHPRRNHSLAHCVRAQ